MRGRRRAAHSAALGTIGAALCTALLGACSSGGGGGGTGAANTAPTASAGADAALSLPSLASLAGAIADDGLTAVTVQWSVVSGPGPVYFVDATSAATQAAIPEEGSYVLRLTADDGEFVDSDDVALTIGAAPGPMVDLAPATTFQTMRGWEATDDASHIGSTSWPNYKDELLDLIVDDLGVTRIRLEVRAGVENSRDYWQEWQDGLIPYTTWRENRYATVNDDASPATTVGSGFHFSEMTHNIGEVLLPFRARVLANGEPFWINVCYVAFTVQNAGGAGYHHADPDEYAEFVQATYDHLGTFGLVPDTWEMILEPDNDPIWTPNKIGQAMVAAGARLQGAGYTPAFVAPSTTSMAAAWQYYDGLSAVTGATDDLVELSYHRYFGANPTNLTAIRTRADAAGIPTSHLEYIGADYEDLHEDLELGGNASWSQYVLAKTGSDDGGAYYLVDETDPLNPVITPGSRTPLLRQYMRYIRPGAVRYEATSDDAGLEPLGFVRGDGGHVVVGKADAGETFFVRGLPPGTYGRQYTTTGSMTPVNLADATLIQGQLLTATLPARGVLTIYAK